MARIRKIGIIGAAILLLGPMAASTVPGAGTRISEAFQPFEKSAMSAALKPSKTLRASSPPQTS
jgi:hypothetical protein